MLFRVEPGVDRYFDRAVRDFDHVERKENVANRITAMAFNALAVGSVSAVFFLPNGDTTSKYEGHVTAHGGLEGALSQLKLEVEGETHAGQHFLDPLAPVLPAVFLAAGVALHLIARGFANRT